MSILDRFYSKATCQLPATVRIRLRLLRAHCCRLAEVVTFSIADVNGVDAPSVVMGGEREGIER
jgi:hypothetical protein